MNSLSRLLIPLLIVLAVADRWRRVDGVVDGEHSWRQAHVVANVDMMLQRGLFTVPSTWNDDLPHQVFDFPVYQGIVAVLAHWSGAAPAIVAETLSVALFAITTVLTAWLARLLGLSRAAAAWSLVFLALSPLARYWFAAALPDDLALCCAVASACGWASAQRARGAAAACAIAAWYGCAFVATLIKPPVYFPVACTIIAVAAWRDGLRGARSGRVVGFAAIAVAAVIVMRLLTHASRNGSGGGGEWAWYFGTAAERSSFDAHAIVLARIGKQAVTVAGLAAAAVYWCARRPESRDAAVVLRVWSAAAVLGSLLFLHVNVVHSYYQLPCAVPFALAAGGGTALLCARICARSSRIVPGVAAAAVLLAVTVWLSEKYLARMLTPATQEMREAGAFLQEHTAATDYVVYVVANPDGNPAFLYFARRRGRNVSADAVTYDTVPAPPATFAARRTVVYATRPAGAAFLADPRWLRLAEHEHGVLLAARER